MQISISKGYPLFCRFMMAKRKLLELTDHGLYCSQGDFFIDPWKKVERALITHSHSDHARPGHFSYLAHRQSESVMKLRLGQNISIQTVEYGEIVNHNGVKISFHSAGHILGSAQIRLEYDGEIWVVSGDYKLESDNLTPEFESVSCDHFITEATFGMPVFQWKPQRYVFDEINQWWKENQEDGKASVLLGYSMGKAQRLLINIDRSIGPVFVHPAIESVNDALRFSGEKIPETENPTKNISKEICQRSLIMIPPMSLSAEWMEKFRPFSVGFASGWMQFKKARKRQTYDRGFVLSDHADWSALNQAVKMTGAENIYVTHGYNKEFSTYLCEQGYNAVELDTLFGDEEDN